MPGNKVTIRKCTIAEYARINPDAISITYSGHHLIGITLKQCFIHMEVLVPLTHDGYLISEEFHSTSPKGVDKIVGTEIELPEMSEYNPCRKMFLVGNLYNYYHWMVNNLPRLDIFRTLDDYRDYTIVMSRLEPWQYESLEFVLRTLNIQDAPCIMPEREAMWFPAENIFLPKPPDSIASMIWREHYCNPPVSTRVRPAPGERIFITRRRAEYRKLSNERDILAALEPFGFVILELDGMPFAEQMSHFENADIIVGPYGAGHANIIFTTKGCVLINLCNEGCTEEAFFTHLTEAVGIRHIMIKGPSTAKYPPPLSYSHCDNFEVSPLAVVNAVRDSIHGFSG